MSEDNDYDYGDLLSLLPCLDQDRQDAFTEKLKMLGVTRKGDLKFVEEADLMPPLEKVEVRKLLNNVLA